MSSIEQKEVQFLTSKLLTISVVLFQNTARRNRTGKGPAMNPSKTTIYENSWPPSAAFTMGIHNMVMMQRPTMYNLKEFSLYQLKLTIVVLFFY